MSDLTVHLVTPEKQLYSGSASEVRVPGWEGEFDVLPGHDLVLALLRGGLVHLATPEGNHRYVVGRGFVEVAGDEVTLLTDHCELADAIDKAAAQASLTEAEQVLGGSTDGTPEWEAAIEQREVALARLTA